VAIVVEECIIFVGWEYVSITVQTARKQKAEFYGKTRD